MALNSVCEFIPPGLQAEGTVALTAFELIQQELILQLVSDNSINLNLTPLQIIVARQSRSVGDRTIELSPLILQLTQQGVAYFTGAELPLSPLTLISTPATLLPGAGDKTLLLSPLALEFQGARFQIQIGPQSYPLVCVQIEIRPQYSVDINFATYKAELSVQPQYDAEVIVEVCH